MKIIFLDIDGVLNNLASIAEGVEILPEKVLLIEDLCKDTNAEVVLSSTWRILHGMGELLFVLECAGLQRDRFIGMTKRLDRSNRGTEIKLWMEEEEIERYVIIDDDSDMLEEQKPFFVQTNISSGLTRAKAKEAREILNG